MFFLFPDDINVGDGEEGVVGQEALWVVVVVMLPVGQFVIAAAPAHRRTECRRQVCGVVVAHYSEREGLWWW